MDSSGIQSKKESEESQQIVSNNVENNKNEKSQDVDTTLKPKEITNPKIFNNPGHQYKKSVQLRECVTSERMRDSTYKPCYPERNPKEFTDNSENRDNRDPLYDNYGGNGVTHIDTHKNCKSGININIVSQQPCENIKLEKPLYTVSFKKCYDKEPELKSGNKRRVIHAMCGGKAKNCGNRMEGKNFRCTFENCCGKCESYIMEMQNNDCNSCNSCNDCNSAWQNNEEDCCCPREMEVVEDYQNPSKQCLQHVHFGSCPKAQNCARSDHSTCSFCSRKCTPSKASLFVEIGESVGNVCNLNSAQAFRCDSMELIDDCMRNEHCSVKRNKSDCFRSKHKCKKNEAKFNPNCQGRPGAMERSYSDGMPRMNLYVDNCTVETQEGWTEMRNTRSITFEETPVRKISTGSDPYLRKQEQCSKHCEHREHSSLTGDSRKGKIWTHLHDTYKSFVNKATTGIGQIVKQTSNKFKRSKTLPKDNHLCSKCASNIIYMDQFSQSEKCNKCAYDSCWQDVDIGQDSNKCEHCCRNMCCDGLPDCQTPMCQNNYSKPECDTREQIQPNTDNYLCGGVRDNFYNCNNDPLAEQLLSLLKCNRSRTKGGGDSFNQRKKQSSCNPRSSNNRGNTVQKNPTKQIVVRRSNPPQTNPPQTNAPQTNAPQTNAPQTNAPQPPARPITRVDVSVQTSFVDTTIDPLEPYTTIYPPSLETTYHRVTISPDQTGISITTSAIDKSQEIESIEDISDEYHRPPFVRRPVEMASIEEIEDVDESTIYRPLPDPRRRMLPPEIEPVDDTTVYRTLPPREEPPVTPEPRPVRRRVVPSPPSLPSPERAEWTPRYVSTPVRAPTPRRVVPSPPTEWTPPRYPPRTPPRPARPPDVRTPPPPPRRPVARPETPRTPPEPTPPPPARAIQCALVKEIRVICTPSLRDVTGRIGDVCACPSKEKVPPPPPVLPKVVTKEPGPPPKPEKPPPPKPETPPPPKPETPPPPKPETPPPAEVAAPEVTPEVVAAEEAPEAAEPPAEEAPAAEEAPEAAPAAEETPEAEAETPAEEKEASPAEEKEEERVEGGEGMHVESGEESPITDTPEEVATATTEEDLIESSDAKEEEERKAEKRELAASPRKEVTSASPEEVRTEVTEPPPLDMSRLPRIQVHTKIPIELARKLEGARTHVNVQMQTSNTILTQILSEFQTGTQKKQLMMSIKLHSDVDEDEDEDDFDIEELPVRRQLFVDDEDDDDEDLEHMRDIEHQPVRRPYPYPPSERVYTPRYDVSTNTSKGHV